MLQIGSVMISPNDSLHVMELACIYSPYGKQADTQSASLGHSKSYLSFWSSGCM